MQVAVLYDFCCWISFIYKPQTSLIQTSHISWFILNTNKTMKPDCWVIACCIVQCDKGSTVEARYRTRAAVIWWPTGLYPTSSLLPHLIIPLPLLQVWSAVHTCHPIKKNYLQVGGPIHSCHPINYLYLQVWGPVHTCHSINYVTAGVRFSSHLSPHWLCHGKCGVQFTLVTLLTMPLQVWCPIYTSHPINLIHCRCVVQFITVTKLVTSLLCCMCGVYFTYVSTIIMSLLVWCLFRICQHFNYVTAGVGFISHLSAL